MLGALPFFTPFFLALRNIRSRRGRTFLTLLGIVLGVAVVLAIQITNQTTLDSLRRVFDRATGQASLMVIPADQEGDTLSEDLALKLGKEGGVVVAAPIVSAQTLLTSEADSWQIAFSMGGVAAGNMFRLYGIDPELDPQIRVYDLQAGLLPKTGKYEVVIPHKYADEKELELDSDLVILIPDGNARLKIVGLLNNEGVALLNDGVVGFAPIQVVQDLFDKGGELDEVALRLDSAISENPQALEAYKDHLNERVGRDAEVVYPSARGQLVSQMLATYQIGLMFFSMISVFVGAFLIYNTFSMTIVERTREIGMLRAIGTSRWYILRTVLAEALLLSILGSALGILAGVYLARGLMTLIGDVITPSQDFISVSGQALAQSLGVGIAVTLAAAIIPATHAARISPLDALRASSRSHESIPPWVCITGCLLILTGWVMIYRIDWPGDILMQVGSLALMLILFGATLTVTLALVWLERLTRPLAARFFGNEGAIGSANIRRSVGRTTMTVASLMVALTMVISIVSVTFSFEEDMREWVDSMLGGDLYVRAAIPMRESFANQLQAVPGVTVVTPARYLNVRLARRSLPPGVVEDMLYFNAIEPATYKLVGDMEFAARQGDPAENWQRLEQGSAIFISNITADRYRLSKGDTITLVTSRGEHDFVIAGEVIDFTGQSGMVFGTYQDLHKWFNRQGADRFTIKVAHGFTVEAVAKEIETRYKSRQHVSVQTTEDFKKNILSLVDQSFRLFDVLSMIGMIIGGLGVVNTLTMNIIERQREIGGLRSLGMTRSQVLRMVLAEALALGVMGAIYGLVFGFFVAQVMIFAMNAMVGYDLTYRFALTPYLVGVLIALGVSQLAAIYPARRAARLNIVEAIKHE